MLDSKLRKEIGFIKNQESRTDLRERLVADSSDSFSSFEYEPRARGEDFSPYRHPVQKIVNKRPSQPVQVKREKEHQVQKKKEPKHPKFSNLMLRNNFIQDDRQNFKITKNRDYEHQSITQELEVINKEIKAVRNKYQETQERYVEDSDGKETPKLADQANFQVQNQEELSLSNIDKFKNNEKQYVSQPLAQQEEQSYPKTQAQYRKYLEQSSDEESEDFREKKTMKTNKQSKKRRHEEQLIAEYDKQDFKDKTMRRAMLVQQSQKVKQPQSNKHGMMQSKGGLCFEVDTKQFKGDTGRPLPDIKQRKRHQQRNTRQRLLIRRQTAKRFDRESRVRLFGYA